MKEPLRVVIVEDGPADVDLLPGYLRARGVDPSCLVARSADEYLQALRGSPDVILADRQLPQFDGFGGTGPAASHGDGHASHHGVGNDRYGAGR